MEEITSKIKLIFRRQFNVVLILAAAVFLTAAVLVLSAFFAGYYMGKKNQAPLSLSNSAEISDPSSQISEGGKIIINEINPPSGYEIKAIYGDIGPKLLKNKVIDFNKMKGVYEKAGKPLTKEQIKILTEGSSRRIKITPENSYFLINFLWAVGLANKNPILDEGPMTKSPEIKIEQYASTGGWTLGTKNVLDIYSKFEIVKISSEQQKILEEFAYNSYRPCCQNPTAYPDCNHGMAMLGLAEIMASQRASLEEIFEAYKYFNGFWFQQNYFDIAKYFKEKEGKNWRNVDARLIAGKKYSTPQGVKEVKKWLEEKKLAETIPVNKGSCGV